MKKKLLKNYAGSWSTSPWSSISESEYSPESYNSDNSDSERYSVKSCGSNESDQELAGQWLQLPIHKGVRDLLLAPRAGLEPGILIKTGTIALRRALKHRKDPILLWREQHCRFMHEDALRNGHLKGIDTSFREVDFDAPSKLHQSTPASPFSRPRPSQGGQELCNALGRPSIDKTEIETSESNNRNAGRPEPSRMQEENCAIRHFSEGEVDCWYSVNPYERQPLTV